MFELVCLVVSRGNLQLVALKSLAGLFDYSHTDNTATIWEEFTPSCFPLKPAAVLSSTVEKETREKPYNFISGLGMSFEKLKKNSFKYNT